MDTDCSLDGYAHLLFHDSTSPCNCELDALPAFGWDDCGLCRIYRPISLEWAFSEKNSNCSKHFLFRLDVHLLHPCPANWQIDFADLQSGLSTSLSTDHVVLLGAHPSWNMREQL